MKKIIRYFLVFTLITYSGLCVALYAFQENLIYHPQNRAVKNEENTYRLQTNVGQTIVTTSIKNTQKAIIYFGGNGEDVSLNLEIFQNTFSDYSLYLMHYRGYGGSDGKPNENEIYHDALALYDLVQNNNTDIIIMGRSLGTGVATRLASEKPASQLILITPYSSIEDIASERFWFFPISSLLENKYLSWQYAQRVEAVTSIFMAEYDQVIPSHSTHKLAEHFKEGIAQIYTFKNAGHNSISNSPQYYHLLKKLTED